jgi:protein AbiQ
MDFFRVSDVYISFLHGIDAKVYFNKSDRNTRPYVGVVLEVGGQKYFAPLTSYKPKQDAFKASDPRFFKIHEKGVPTNKLGMIALNNMIPVIDTQITRIEFSAQPERYRRMLLLQRAYLLSNQEHVRERAHKLYELITIRKHAYYSRYCCDFSLLEAKHKDFKGTEPEPEAQADEGAAGGAC